MRFVSLLLASLLTGCGGSTKNTIVVYSPHGPEMLNTCKDQFEALHPDVEVLVYDMPSQRVYDRVMAESNNPAGDIWWGGPSTLFRQAAQDGLLQPYKPTWATEVEEEFRDPQDRWYGTYKSPIVIVFNDRHYKRDAVPQTWDDLLKPEWDQKITIRKPLASGTMKTFLCARIMAAESEGAGIEWLRKLHAATEAYMETPQLLFDHIKRNEDLVSVWLLPDIVMQRNLNAYPFGFVVPPDAPVLTEGIAIMANAPHAELATQFYEFVTSKEALVYQAETFSKMPARGDIAAEELPEWMVEQPIQAMKIDWARFAANQVAWCDRWDREVYSAP